MRAFGREIGHNAPTLIVAEAGVNHNGDVGLASELIEVAAEAGADAVKFQSLNAAGYISRHAPKAQYQMETTRGDETQLDMVKQYELSRSQHVELKSRCEKLGLGFFSTPFEESAVDLLEDIGVEIYKIPSGEITNLPLLAHTAKKQKPIILSTGMSFLGEVEEAVRVIRENGPGELILLHCVSNYPADPKDANLKAMSTMAQAFNLSVGYSDHTPGSEVALAAVALGACVVEKHLTLDKEMVGPDHKASLSPEELQNLVAAIRTVESCFGDGIKRPMPSEENTRKVARKSLVAAEELPSGTTLTHSNVLAKRPGTGISPAEAKYAVGRRLVRDMQEDEILRWDCLE